MNLANRILTLINSLKIESTRNTDVVNSI